MTVLDVATAYRLWAPDYSAENAISRIEDGLVSAMTPPLTGRRLLDAGCGTGRRLGSAGAAKAIGVDQSPEMLAVARSHCPPEVTLLTGDLRELPLADACVDVSWCRLVIGHLGQCVPAYRELARVTSVGGWVIVTDFHPDAVAAGHRRTFRVGGEVHEVEHHCHTADHHLAAAADAGLSLHECRSGAIGEEVRALYAAAGRGTLYTEHRGLNVVIALAFRRER